MALGKTNSIIKIGTAPEQREFNYTINANYVREIPLYDKFLMAFSSEGENNVSITFFSDETTEHWGTGFSVGNYGASISYINQLYSMVNGTSSDMYYVSQNPIKASIITSGADVVLKVYKVS